MILAALLALHLFGMRLHASEPQAKVPLLAEAEALVNAKLDELRPQLLAAVIAELEKGVIEEPRRDEAGAGDGESPRPLVTTQDVTSAAFLGPGPGSAPPDRGALPGGATFSFNAGEQNSRATIRIASDSSGSKEEPVEAAKVRRFSTKSIALSSPFDKKNVTNVATLDGFANSTELRLDFSKWYVPGLRNPFGTEEYDSWCRLANAKDDCQSHEVKEGLQRIGLGHLFDEFRGLYLDPDRRRWSWGALLKVGHESFDYFGPELTKQDTSKVAWAAGAHFGWIPRHSKMFNLVGVEWQRSYVASRSTAACLASEDTVLSCVTGALAEPTEKNKHLVYWESRGTLPLYASPRSPERFEIGFALRATYDFRNDESGVDLPIYLLRNSEGALTGGVRLGWTSTDQFGFGIFVTSPLKVFQ
jgi:hypothetical protein